MCSGTWLFVTVSQVGTHWVLQWWKMPSCFLILPVSHLCLGGGIFFRPSSLPSQIGKTFHESLTELWRCFLLLLFVPWLVSLALSKPKLHLSTNHPSSQGGPTAAPLHRQLAPSPHLLLTWGWACCLWCLFTCRCAGGKRAAVKLEIGPGSDLQ